MIEEAVAFAIKAHEGTLRKGTNIPYIVHPLETAVIVSLMVQDEEIICAALLHDVVEDTCITEEQLEEAFGSRVTSLVMCETEDKQKNWKERKAATLRRLETASREAKILALGDKLSNLRCTARDYMAMGDRVWERFNEKDKQEHGWYYTGVAARLADLNQFYAYKEYCGLCRQVFGGSHAGLRADSQEQMI